MIGHFFNRRHRLTLIIRTGLYQNNQYPYQYKERIINYHELDMEISELECTAREAELSKLRLLDMSKNIGGQRLTAETLTKPIVNTCLQAIIVVNRHELVFVLPNNENPTSATSKKRGQV